MTLGWGYSLAIFLFICFGFLGVLWDAGCFFLYMTRLFGGQ